MSRVCRELEKRHGLVWKMRRINCLCLLEPSAAQIQKDPNPSGRNWLLFVFIYNSSRHQLLHPSDLGPSEAGTPLEPPIGGVYFSGGMDVADTSRDHHLFVFGNTGIKRGSEFASEHTSVSL